MKERTRGKKEKEMMQEKLFEIEIQEWEEKMKRRKKGEEQLSNVVQCKARGRAGSNSNKRKRVSKEGGGRGEFG